MKTLKVLPSVFLLGVTILCGPMMRNGEASWLGRVSLTTMEGYMDNLRFSDRNEKDFVSRFIPTLTLIHEAPWQTVPDFAARLSVAGEYFAQHPTLNNFGNNVNLNTVYQYPYSPRLGFLISDSLQRQGESRTGDNEGILDSGMLRGQGTLGGGGGVADIGAKYGSGMQEKSTCSRTTSLSRESGFGSINHSLVTQGQQLENQTRVGAEFQYSPTLTFRGSYCWDYLGFLDAGGNELSHSISIDGNYKIWKQHSLRVHYTLSIFRSRDGHQSLIHDFDFGDSFLSEREMHLTPTLTLSVATGIAFLTDNGGNQQSSGTQGQGSKFRLENKLDVHLTKLWEAAAFALGVRRGLTGSLGVAGPSFTTSFFGHLSAQLTQRLSAVLSTEYDSFDTDEGAFDTFLSFITLQYQVTSWLSCYLNYSYRMSDAGSGVTNNTILPAGLATSNSIFLGFSVAADVWPNVGFARE